MDEMIDREESCIEKAKANGEPTFTLRAQDITASYVVQLWASMQRGMRDMMDAGASMAEALETVRLYHKIPHVDMMGDSLTEKDRGALDIARAMQEWGGQKKLAD